MFDYYANIFYTYPMDSIKYIGSVSFVARRARKQVRVSSNL